MTFSARSAVGSFHDPAHLRQAVSALVAAGFADEALTVVDAERGGKASATTAELPRHYARQLARKLEEGAVLLFVRVRDPDEEKRASLTLLEHSDGAVQVHDLSRG